MVSEAAYIPLAKRILVGVKLIEGWKVPPLGVIKELMSAPCASWSFGRLSIQGCGTVAAVLYSLIYSIWCGRTVMLLAVHSMFGVSLQMA